MSRHRERADSAPKRGRRGLAATLFPRAWSENLAQGLPLLVFGIVCVLLALWAFSDHLAVGLAHYPLGMLFLAFGGIASAGGLTAVFFGGEESPPPFAPIDSADWVTLPRPEYEALVASSQSSAPTFEEPWPAPPPAPVALPAPPTRSPAAFTPLAALPVAGHRVSVPLETPPDPSPNRAVAPPAAPAAPARDPLVAEMAELVREMHELLGDRAEWREDGPLRPSASGARAEAAPGPAGRATEAPAKPPRSVTTLDPELSERFASLVDRLSNESGGSPAAQTGVVASATRPPVACVACRTTSLGSPTPKRCDVCRQPMCESCYRRAVRDRDRMLCPECAVQPGSLF